MDGDGASTATAHTAWPEWAGGADGESEVERSASCPSGVEVVGRLLGWARAGHRRQVDLEVGLGEEPLVGDWRHLGDKHATRVMECLTRLPIAICAVADRFFDAAPRVPLAGFDYGQRLVVVERIAGEHVHRSDQLALGVHRDLGLVSVEALAFALPPVPHLRVMHREHPIATDTLFEHGTVVVPL